jgi:hypothetical protein
MKDIVMIHHSFTEDNKLLSSYEAIDRYHAAKGWKAPISKKAIGYQLIIEYVNGKLTARQGRLDTENAAACKEARMNGKALHVCVVGNFDVTKPSEELYIFIANEIKKRWPATKTIEPHNKYATYKTCPGKLFDMAHLRELVFGNSLKPELIRALSVTLERVKTDQDITAQINYLAEKLFKEYKKEYKGGR